MVKTTELIRQLSAIFGNNFHNSRQEKFSEGSVLVSDDRTVAIEPLNEYSFQFLYKKINDSQLSWMKKKNNLEYSPRKNDISETYNARTLSRILNTCYILSDNVEIIMQKNKPISVKIAENSQKGDSNYLKFVFYLTPFSD